MRFRPSLTLFVLAGSLASPAAHSQNPPADAAPSLRTSSNLVLVDVVVTDHDKPVHGLDRSRFHILEDGSEQTISSFDEHQPAAAPPAFLAPAALPPNTYTNLPAYPDSPAVNVLLLDALNTPTGDQMRVRSKMIDYLATLKPGTELAIFTLGTQLPHRHPIHQRSRRPRESPQKIKIQPAATAVARRFSLRAPR